SYYFTLLRVLFTLFYTPMLFSGFHSSTFNRSSPPGLLTNECLFTGANLAAFLANKLPPYGSFPLYNHSQA
ncbi:MAG: hypothetical protein V4714_02665, partial [Bacteroidota bacterium]